MGLTEIEGNIPSESHLPQDVPHTNIFPSPRFDSYNWALPLESLVLDAGCDDIPLEFLKVYPTILRKFPGPPCEALGRTITYLQALFTESSGFHPYITHLPTLTLPNNHSESQKLAKTLERGMIRIVQHLLSFFQFDTESIERYITTCPAELIPRPSFLFYEGHLDTDSQIIHVGPFRNASRREKLWKSPYPNSYWRQDLIDRAMSDNIRRCESMIDQKSQALPQTTENLVAMPPLAGNVDDAIPQSLSTQSHLLVNLAQSTSGPTGPRYLLNSKNH